ncbi:FAD-binding oxidoreductase [Paenibacillus sp. 1001270B_150601_E10]|uniref:FAD-binding oxidoreductase n=1 Tax=Paenibacillus sp. 1001270B_150601_E10 TaxID=2787079 RepID=UPI0018A0ECD8|nr:FAD-binding oxidoreductase [Paenibacillus sp. 1001270B_150601_E10]
MLQKRFRTKILAVALIGYAALFASSLWVHVHTEEVRMRSDVGGILSSKIYEVIKVKSSEDIQEALLKAKRLDKKISVSGSRHSQGGQSFYDDAIVLDMREYNSILYVDPTNKLARVQSGATWLDIHEAINPYHLAVRVMQSSAIFTLGGSMSANAHGRDPSEGSLIESIESFRIMMADGTIVEASRTSQPDLFHAVIGGYGLFGVILDADVRLTEDEVYEQKITNMMYTDYPKFFDEHIIGNPEAALTIGRLSTAPSSYLTQMYALTMERTDEPLTPALTALEDERFVESGKFIFGLSRKWDRAKNWSWKLQKQLYRIEEGKRISRNNAMRNDVEFTMYRDPQKTDLLQEYYVPVDRFVPFVDGLREILREEELNVLNITVRYVPKSYESVLSYAKKESFSLVLLINHKKSPKDLRQLEQATRRIVDLSLEQEGSFYLTYQNFPTLEQLKKAYPNWEKFKQFKQYHDPEGRFMNEWYARYSR